MSWFIIYTVERTRYKYSNRKIIRADKEEVDVEVEMQYNRKKTTYWQFNELATMWASSAQEGELFAGYKNGNF